MKPLTLDFSFMKSAIIVMTFSLLPSLSYADSVELDLEKMCARQSIIIAAELRSNATSGFTAQDMRMIRLGAVHSCMETYKSRSNSPEAVKLNPSNQTVAGKSEEKEEQADNDKRESIFDRLLRTESNDDVSPMQKRHRTGGK